MHHLSQRRQVVVGQPVPESQLRWQHDGLLINDRKNPLIALVLRWLAVQQYDQTGVYLLPSKLHLRPHADLQLRHQCFGYCVGIRATYGQRQDYLRKDQP